MGGRRRSTATARGPVGQWVGVNTVRPAREPHPPMTAAEHPHDHHLSTGPAQPPDPLARSELIAAGDIDVVPGDPPVPIAVWRVADVDTTYGHANADALTPRPVDRQARHDYLGGHWR